MAEKDTEKNKKMIGKGKSKNEIDVEPELEEAVLSPMERRKRGITMKRYAKKIALARKRSEKKTATKEKLMGRATKQAIKQVRAKIAGDRGKSYGDLGAQEKSAIDKRVHKRKDMVNRIAKRLMPKVKQMERDRRAGKNQPMTEEQKKVRKFHRLYDKNNKPKIDKRFKIYKTVAESIVAKIREKQAAEKDRLRDKHKREIHRANVQNSAAKMANEDMEKLFHDLTEGEFENVSASTLVEGITDSQRKRYDAAANAFMAKMVKDSGKKHTLGWAASETQKVFPLMDVNDLVDTYTKANPSVKSANRSSNKFIRSFGIRLESGGAGEKGTEKLKKKYMKDTPCAKIIESYLAEETVSMEQMKAFERFVDKMFAKFKIDFEFSKHFGERMDDTRNKPDIKLKEVAEFIQKIYRNQGKSIKSYKDAQVVIKDMQKELNIPVVIDYDEKKDEFEVTAKTIMRKKNFKSTNPEIKY